jgi:hypothetical protein
MAVPMRGSLRTTASAMPASSQPARAVVRRPGPDSTSGSESPGRGGPPPGGKTPVTVLTRL